MFNGSLSPRSRKSPDSLDPGFSVTWIITTRNGSGVINLKAPGSRSCSPDPLFPHAVVGLGLKV